MHKNGSGMEAADESSTLQQVISQTNGISDQHNQAAMISVRSGEDHLVGEGHLLSKMSEENTFTIKMSDANEKEKRLIKKLERV